jgi:DNA-binding MarR family transcriptional regulator
MKESTGRRRGGGRTRIARALATAPKTVPQIASLLDTTDGALRAAVNGMEADGQIARVEPVVRRGQRWELTAAGRAELLESAATVEPGVVLPGQRLLVLVDQGQGVTAEAWDALAEDGDSVLWAARLDGNGALLLALDGGDPVGADRLRARLSSAGMSSVAGRVSDTYEARALRPRRARALTP